MEERKGGALMNRWISLFFLTLAIATMASCTKEECRAVPHSNFGPNPGGEDSWDDYDY